MRLPALIPLALLLSACWTPGPGQVDPTRYPWDPRNQPALAPAPPPHPRVDARGLINPVPDWRKGPPPAPQPSPAEGSYCVMQIEQERQTGITISANSGVMACTAQPNAAPSKPPK